MVLAAILRFLAGILREEGSNEAAVNGGAAASGEQQSQHVEEEALKDHVEASSRSFALDANDAAGDESGSEEEQAAFMKELQTFHRERSLDFRPPKFYQKPLNCLKLWRAVVRRGGYQQVTSLKLWRQVGDSFNPPKTCTSLSWAFRGFYAKALLEYEKHKMRCGELPFTDPAAGNQVDPSHASGSGRARKDGVQGWHSQQLLGNGEAGDPIIIKDENPVTRLRNIGKPLPDAKGLKRKGSSSPVEHAAKVSSKPQSEIRVWDVGVPSDWVKVNVQRKKDCYEIYALVPGLLREEASYTDAISRDVNLVRSPQVGLLNPSQNAG